MAFDINNYQEKYRWTGKNIYNTAVELRIYERTTTVYNVRTIRGLVDIRLQMQGSSGKIWDPIVKTNLTFSLVDAPDLVASRDEKSGDWQEFYTPDATKYLVVLYRGGLLVWRGYITPDSWKESLSYRGTIEITARDNLGHLQDIPFDGTGNAEGLMQIRQIVTDALDAIDFPMQLYTNYNTGDAQILRDSHVFLLDSYVAVSEFEDDSWWDVLEKVLDATGYTLRYRGGSEYLAPIRNLPLGSYSTRAAATSSAVDIEFYGGDREMDPAVRLITEDVTFGSEMEIDVTQQKSWLYGATTANTYSGNYTDLNGIGRTFTGRSWKNGNTDFATKGGWSDSFGYLNPQRCQISTLLQTIDGKRALDLGVGLAAGQSQSGTVIPSWRVRAYSTDVTLRLEFARTIQLDNGSYPFTASPFVGYLMQIRALVSYIDPNGTTWYWQTFNGVNAWTTSSPAPHIYDIVTTTPVDMPDTFALDIPLKDISDKTTLGGWLQIEFYNFIHVGITPGTIYGLFDRCTAIKATQNAKSVLKRDTVTTVNNADYNVKLERKPAFGAMSAVVPWLSPKNYTKALWTYDSAGNPTPVDYALYFNGYASTTAIPLPAQIAKQILTFNHIPLEILGGNCGAVNKTVSLGFNNLLKYKGKYHVIQGGTLDVLKNRISGAVLHDFIWYADMWDESSNPNYTVAPKYETNSTLNGANGNSAIK